MWVVLVAVVLFVLVGAGGSRDVLRARQVEVVDADGNVRILLDTNTDGSPKIRMKSADGKRLIEMVGQDEGGAISLFDREHNDRIILAVLDEFGGIDMIDAHQHLRFTLREESSRMELAMFEASKGPARIRVFGPSKDDYAEYSWIGVHLQQALHPTPAPGD